MASFYFHLKTYINNKTQPTNYYGYILVILVPFAVDLFLTESKMG